MKRTQYFETSYTGGVFVFPPGSHGTGIYLNIPGNHVGALGTGAWSLAEMKGRMSLTQKQAEERFGDKKEFRLAVRMLKGKPVKELRRLDQ